MAGLLLRALAGATKGLGDSMIEKAKNARADQLDALKRSQSVEDRDAGFAHQDKNLATTEAGADSRLATSEAGANTRNAATIAGSAANTAATEAGANTRNAATIKAEGTRQQAGFSNDASTVDKVIPQDDGTEVGVTKKGAAVPIKTADGAPVRGEVALSPADTRLLSAYKERNVLKDADGQIVKDTYGHPQPDWDAIDAQLRSAGKGALADRISGVAPGGGGAFSNYTVGGVPDTTAPSFGASNLGGGLLNPSGKGPASIIAPQASFDPSKATATATNPKTGAKIFQIGNQWFDATGKPVP